MRYVPVCRYRVTNLVLCRFVFVYMGESGGVGGGRIFH